MAVSSPARARLVKTTVSISSESTVATALAAIQDQHPEEHATCYIVKGRGLVVISSCGHAGIINSVKTALAVSGVDKLHAVIGGFHLGMAPDEYIQHTVDELEALNPDVVVPMHCTGTRFIEAFRQRMPDKIVASNLGSLFTFGV